MSICPKCGADKENYKEAMGVECGCVTSPQYITKVIKQLFRKDQITTPDKKCR